MDVSSSPQLIEHISHSVPFTPFDIHWVPCSAKVVTVGNYARGSGAIQVHELSGPSASSLSLVQNQDTQHGIKCSTFGASLFENRHLSTGNYNGDLIIYDLEQLSKPVYKVSSAHSSLINSIDGCGGLNVGSGSPEIVTGSRDGCVRVWDVRQETPVASLEPAPGQASRDCWAVAFGNSYNDSERCVVSGYDNGDIKLLCLRTNRLLWQTNVSNGVVGLQFDRKDIPMNKLVVTTLESKFRVYDMKTLHPELGYSWLSEKAHNSTVWLSRHLPQNRDVWATTGGNGSVNLWKYSYPSQRSLKDEKGVDRGVMGTVEMLNTKKISDQPIVAWDWNGEKTGLACAACLDQTIKVVIVTKLNLL